MTQAGHPQASRRENLVWIGLLLGLAIWTAWRLGAFDLWSTVVTADGRAIRFPNGLAIVDHPFHATRAETLRRSLADGEILRWIGHHQGGYPTEFYPLGVAWLDVGVWIAAFGTLPMMAVHKLVVIGIFLLPGLAFAWLAKAGRCSLGIALVAFAAHVSVRGWWWSGGAMELVEWGLVTNVAAATLLLISIPPAVAFFQSGVRWAGGATAVLAGFALLTNPRSGIALATLLVGTGATVALTAVQSDRPAVVRRVVLAGMLAGLIAAPEIVSLIRFNNLYYFVPYSGYADIGEYLESSIQAIGGPVFLLGLLGVVLAAVPGSSVLNRAVAATTALYVLGTVSIVAGIGPGALIAQLETTRLMPFQRLLWIYLAATAAAWLLAHLAGGASSRLASPLVAVASVAIVLLYVVAPPSFIPEGDRGLVRQPGSAQPGIVDLETAVVAADKAAVEGTALLVLGTTLSWHDQLWAPMWSDRPFFFDDWLWYWQQRHFGDYDPEREHAYRSDESALSADYLQAHGIGAVVVTGQAKPAARRNVGLLLVREGIWDVYRVERPTTIIDYGGEPPVAARIDGQSFSAEGTTADGTVTIRRNWFPRWQATVDGRDAKIEQTADGYVRINAAPGKQVTVDVTYRVDPWDWLARLLAVAGVAGVALCAVPGRWLPGRRILGKPQLMDKPRDQVRPA